MSRLEVEYEGHMGFLSKILDAVVGEEPAVKQARAAMKRDAQADPRRAAVFGLLAVSYEVDPGYLVEHATTALRDWYGVTSADGLRRFRPARTSHPAYDIFRFTFLARAGAAAGLLSEAESWTLAFVQLTEASAAYPTWRAYGNGYLAGHLAYRTAQGDNPEALTRIEKNLTERLAKLEATVWKALPRA